MTPRIERTPSAPPSSSSSSPPLRAVSRRVPRPMSARGTRVRAGGPGARVSAEGREGKKGVRGHRAKLPALRVARVTRTEPDRSPGNVLEPVPEAV